MSKKQVLTEEASVSEKYATKTKCRKQKQLFTHYVRILLFFFSFPFIMLSFSFFHTHCSTLYKYLHRFYVSIVACLLLIKILRCNALSVVVFFLEQFFFSKYRNINIRLLELCFGCSLSESMGKMNLLVDRNSNNFRFAKCVLPLVHIEQVHWTCLLHF